MENFKNLLTIKPFKEDTKKDCIEVTVCWDYNDGDEMDESFDLCPDDFFNDKKLIYYLAYASCPYDFKGHNWNDNVFYHHITDNTDIPDLFEYLSEGGFTIYFEDYPCHSLLYVDIIYYDSNGDKFDITFDDIINDWKNKSYEEICDFLNSL